MLEEKSWMRLSTMLDDVGPTLFLQKIYTMNV